MHNMSPVDLFSFGFSFTLGAAHLYLLDFAGDALPELEASLKDAYPETKVRTREGDAKGLFHSSMSVSLQITVVQGDAADNTTITSLCQRAISEEGRLDVFFANAGIAAASLIQDITPKAFMEMMRVNVLS